MRRPETVPLVVCIDGGPCSGKSSVLAALETEDFDVPMRVVPELATQFGEELLTIGTDYPRLAAENRTEYLTYQKRILHGYKEHIACARSELSETGGIVLLDRGAAGVRSYVTESEWERLTKDIGTDPERIIHESADAVIFLGSLAVENPTRYEKLRRSNPLRTETVMQATELHHRSLDNWEGHPNMLEIGGDDILPAKQKNLLILSGDCSEACKCSNGVS